MKRFIWGAGALVALAAAIVAAVVVAVMMAVQPAQAQEPRVVLRAGLTTASIGVTVRDVTADDAGKAKMEHPAGVYIENVQEASPAAKAGLQPGDIVIDFDGERVRSVSHFSRLVQESVPDRQLPASIIRGTSRQTLTVVPEAGGALTRLSRPAVRQLDELQRNLQRDIQRDLKLDLDPEAIRRGLRSGPLAGGVLGVSVSPLTEQLATYFGVQRGVLVSAVSSNSPAAAAGVRAGDVITAMNGQTVSTSADVTRALRQNKAGSVEISVVRDKKQLSLRATIPSTTPRVPSARSGRRGLPV